MSYASDLVRTAINGLRPARSGWARTLCPFCIDRVGTPDRRGSLAFYFPYGYFKCFRCAIKGVVDGWVSDFKDEDFDHAGFHLKKAPAWYLPTWDETALTSLSMKPAIEYAEGRGFDLAIRQAAGMGACLYGDARYEGRLIIPHTDEKGEWWGFTARKFYSRVPQPYMYPPGMTRDRLFNEVTLQTETDDPALLMEGVLDGLLYWPDCVCGLGKPIEDHVRVLKQTKRPVAVVLDGDAHRDGERFMLRLRIEGIPAGAVRLPPGRDPNDRKKVNPEDVRRAAAQCLKSPRPVQVQECSS